MNCVWAIWFNEVWTVGLNINLMLLFCSTNWLRLTVYICNKHLCKVYYVKVKCAGLLCVFIKTVQTV